MKELEDLGRRVGELEAENARLKKDLQQSEELFGKIFHASSNVMAIHTIREGRFVDLNEACARLGGFKREELIGRTMEEWDLIQDEELKEKVGRKLREEGRVINLESKIRTKDGEIRTVLFSADPVTINNEPCLLGVSVDITEREKEASALRESEERFRLIAETIDEIFWLMDEEEHGAVYLSPAYDRIWGCSRDLVAKNPDPFMMEMVHPEDRPEVVEFRKRLRAGQPVSYEYRIIRPDGSIRNIWDRAYPIMNRNGRISRFVGVGQDVTEWRRAEAAIIESKEYLNQIINCIGDPIFVKDREHRFMLVNDALCVFTGLKREELLGTAGMPPSMERSLWDQEEQVFETGREALTEDIFSDEQGNSLTVMTKKSLLTDQNGRKYIVGVLRDVTEHKRLEAQFLQAQKMEAVGVLAGGVAHDFNNLLNVINGYTELILEDLVQGDPFREELEQVRNAGQRAAALTSQLLDFGRKQILQPEVLDLNRVIADMSSMVQRMIGEDIEIVFNPQPAPAMVHADPAKVQQVIMNLIVNARDAMPDGGRVTIESAGVELDEGYLCDHPMAKPGPYIMLAISDTGMGMDAATQAHIFEPFFTTKAKGKGTGLGLSTVYGIVKQSGGFIWVYSEPGKGTTIKVYFRRANDRIVPATAENRTESEFRGRETILLVEDEEAVRSLTSRVLRSCGYNVLEAADGLEALCVSRDFASQIHLVLTDVVMPGLGGKALVAQLEELRPGVKALFISGYTDNAISHHGILDSDVAFLQKPFARDGLIRKVREVLDAPAL